MTTTPNQSNPKDGIIAIERSLSCFAFGLASLIPVIGFGLAFVAFKNFHRARAASNGAWNPAWPQLAWGIALATLGLTVSSFLLLVFVAGLLKFLPGQYSG
jgi:hypothetical protein